MAKKLEKFLLNLSPRHILEAEACTGCGECLKLCPIYALEPDELLSARGKIDLYKYLLRAEKPLLSLFFQRGREEDFQKFQDVLWKCTVCGQCHFVCPARIDTPNLWEALREMMGAGGYGPPQEQYEYLQKIKTWDNSFSQPQIIRRTWLDEAYQQGKIAAPVPSFQDHKAPVLYFLGCTATYDPAVRQVAVDTINVMQRAGVDFAVLGEKELCCSGKLKRMGEPAFKERAMRNMKLLNSLGIKTLVASCAGCFKTINEDYPKITAQGFEVLHISQFVYRLLQEGSIILHKAINDVITYHDPCHLGRNCGVYQEPRQVLKSIPGLRLIEMERHHQYAKCCGGGGGLKLVDHDLQIRASAARIRDGEQTGANTMVTPCPTCYLTLEKGKEYCNSSLKLMHFMSMVRIAMGLPGEYE